MFLLQFGYFPCFHLNALVLFVHSSLPCQTPASCCSHSTTTTSFFYLLALHLTITTTTLRGILFHLTALPPLYRLRYLPPSLLCSIIYISRIVRPLSHPVNPVRPLSVSKPPRSHFLYSVSPAFFPSVSWEECDGGGGGGGGSPYKTGVGGGEGSRGAFG